MELSMTMNNNTHFIKCNHTCYLNGGLGRVAESCEVYKKGKRWQEN